MKRVRIVLLGAALGAATALPVCVGGCTATIGQQMKGAAESVDQGTTNGAEATGHIVKEGAEKSDDFAGVTSSEAALYEANERAQHRMHGYITTVDHESGTVDVNTAEALLQLRFSPEAVSHLQKGDEIAVTLAYAMVDSGSGAADERTRTLASAAERSAASRADTKAVEGRAGNSAEPGVYFTLGGAGTNADQGRAGNSAKPGVLYFTLGGASTNADQGRAGNWRSTPGVVALGGPGTNADQGRAGNSGRGVLFFGPGSENAAEGRAGNSRTAVVQVAPGGAGTNVAEGRVENSVKAGDAPKENEGAELTHGKYWVKGTVSDVHHDSGVVSVIGENAGTLKLHFPPADITNLHNGEHIAIEMAFEKGEYIE